MFLEGHMEVTPGWIEPMLQHVAQFTKSVAIPVLDKIEFTTLNFKEKNPEGSRTWVDFDWDGSFGYKRKKVADFSLTRYDR